MFPFQKEGKKNPKTYTPKTPTFKKLYLGFSFTVLLSPKDINIVEKCEG